MNAIGREGERRGVAEGEAEDAEVVGRTVAPSAARVFFDAYEVLQTLGHLPTLDMEMPGVQPVSDPRSSGRWTRQIERLAGDMID